MLQSEQEHFMDSETESVFKSWLTHTFRPGDIVHVKWEYDSINELVRREEIFLMLRVLSSDEGCELWEVMQVDGNSSFCEIMCSSNAEDCSEEWQKITIVSRS